MKVNRIIAAMCVAIASATGCVGTDPPAPPEDDNIAPVAAAGNPRTVDVGETVILDGSGSFDEDGDALSYRWVLAPAPGSITQIAQPTDMLTSFVPDVSGEFAVTLIVNDGTEDSEPDTIRITVDSPLQENRPPVADAGVDRQVRTGDTVQLSGQLSSDVDGDPLTYSWSLISKPLGSAASIAQPAAESTDFVADVDGTYTAQLFVRDGRAQSPPAQVTITATPEMVANQRPVAKAGVDQVVAEGSEVTLDGSASADPDGDPITYMWTLQAPPASNATLSDPTAVRPSFTADLEGTYIATLIVDDGMETSTADMVQVTATRNNQPPVASAGAGNTVGVGAQVTLDATGSSDPDEDPLTFRWAIDSSPNGSGASLSDATSATPSVTLDVEGTYVFSLVVNDSKVDSAPVTVSFEAANLCLVISEVVEDGNTKAVELYNCGGNNLDVTGLLLCSNNTQSSCNGAPLAGVITAGDVLVVCGASASNSIPAATCDVDMSTAGINFNGDDAIVVYDDRDSDDKLTLGTDEVLDAFGQPFAAKPSMRIWEDAVWRRCVQTPYDGSSAWDVATYFQSFDKSDFSDLGTAPSLTSCP